MATRKTVSPNAQSCRMRLVRAGVEFEAEGEQKFVLEMVARFLASEISAPASSSEAERTQVLSSYADGARAAGKTMSVREFIGVYDVKRHTDLVVAFGYFLEKQMGQESFTPADINGLYYEAKLENSNTSHMLIQNIKRGYVMEAKNSEGKRKRFVLTTSGERFVEGKRQSSTV